MNLQKYIDMENAVLTDEMEKILSKEGKITKLDFSDKNKVLTDHELWNECGYTKLTDGSYLVAMTTPMPLVTKEMVNWWFWWHPQSSKRYQAWYPKEHYKISYHKKDKEYFSSKTVPEFKTNTQYPLEKIGKLIAPLSIEFVSPTDFGFLESFMKANNVKTAICGHVGAFKGLIQNTEMAHIFIQSPNGPILVSRFWLGKNLKSKTLKKLLITKKSAKDMAIHCYIEYQNFAKKIPLMHEEWQKTLD